MENEKKKKEREMKRILCLSHLDVYRSTILSGKGKKRKETEHIGEVSGAKKAFVQSSVSLVNAIRFLVSPPDSQVSSPSSTSPNKERLKTVELGMRKDIAKRA